LRPGTSKNACNTQRFGKFLSGEERFFTFTHNLISDALAAQPIMSLVLSDVMRLATLAQLEITETEAAATLEKLNDFFAIVEQMRAVDTTGVEPLNHPIAALQQDLALRLRDDVATETNRREDYQKVAPAIQDGLYLVPKVIE
jgi:aspartyl-tRNA(Asn)/glutamyl-tRNA(Gln) amidotransferase subunit C